MFCHLSLNKTLDEQEKDLRTNTMRPNDHCRRCGGLMVHDDCLDVASDTGEVRIAVLRCFACGELIDHTILRNRREPIKPVTTGVRRRRVTAANPQSLAHQN